MKTPALPSRAAPRLRFVVKTSWIAIALGLGLASIGSPAQALSIRSVSPQGEVSRAQQIVVSFDEDAVAFGAGDLPAPVQLQCSNAHLVQSGTGRWTQAREWVFDFKAPLPRGVRCSVQVAPDFRAPSGKPIKAITGAQKSHTFDTGGPRIRHSSPYENTEIEEDQRFVVKLDAPATLSSLKAGISCRIPGLGERVPAQLLMGDERRQLLKSLGDHDDAEIDERPQTSASSNASSSAPTTSGRADHAAQAATQASTAGVVPSAKPPATATVTNPQMDKASQAQANPDSSALLALQCPRRFSPNTEITLVFGPNIQSAHGVATRREQQISFRVRPPFVAEISCERENAVTACLPFKPIQLKFSSPITLAQARNIRLVPEPSNEQKKSANQQAATTSAGQQPSPAANGQNPGASPSPLKVEYLDESDDAIAMHDNPPGESLVKTLRFSGPFAENGQYLFQLPESFRDASGRALVNADPGRLNVAIGTMPPLAKFASAPFGVIERHAEGRNGTAVMPVTLRHVESDLTVEHLQVSELRADNDPDIIRWLQLLERFEQDRLSRTEAAEIIKTPLPEPAGEEDADVIETRRLSLLADQAQSKQRTLPAERGTAGRRPFEVVGIGLTPGFHVLEIGSRQLGQALLDPDYGEHRTLYTRTGALVTNLAVHFKLGRENALAWVTTLDEGKPVANAQVRVSDCNGKAVAEAHTDAQGVARLNGLDPQPPRCRHHWNTSSYFVSARTQGKDADLAFTWSHWQRGIEPWRFGAPTENSRKPDERIHTVFDRPLLRAGETVSMKHFIRTETATKDGFGLPDKEPDTLIIRHEGSGQEYTLPLAWRTTATGGRSAESQFQLPTAARLGRYRVSFKDRYDWRSNSGFQVQDFRLPVFEGGIRAGISAPLVGLKTLPLDIQLNYLSGGPASQLPVQVSASHRSSDLHFGDYEAFRFASPETSTLDDQETPAPADAAAPATENTRDEAEDIALNRLILDKHALKLDAHGHARMNLKLPPQREPVSLNIEASYADPNGEIQTLRQTLRLLPAAVIAGIRADDWVSVDRKLNLQTVTLTPQGKPAPNTPIEVRAVRHHTSSIRKRLVGGFYSYENHDRTEDLGTVCKGTSNAQGLFDCSMQPDTTGSIELIATATDAEGRQHRAGRSVWVTTRDELWFAAEDHDRMDLIPEQKRYAPGDVARFQVRMPFRHATALVTIEREGIMESRVVELHGDDPTISLKVDESWSPNVYVSVLALRGRVRDVPWYSLFDWGYRNPAQWWREFSEDRVVAPPTALVDLSKPAYRMGMAEIRVDDRSHRLDIKISTDKHDYPVRGTAEVQIEARRPDGQPAAHAEVAVAAVDQALLELLPNTSWNLLDAMMARRAWGVSTSTAQMEIVGRRHYGLKAVAAGGDGSSAPGMDAPARELFNTLLMWNPRVQLDAQGRASLRIPLNDALTTFRIVAVGDSGTHLFGTGETRIRTTQDLQLISGLPPLVRAGDRFQAMLTLRNTTTQPMDVILKARATMLQLQDRTVQIPAGTSRDIHWEVTAPVALADLRNAEILWKVDAEDRTSGKRDQLKISQRVLPAIPVSVQQASLLQLDGSRSMPVAAPAHAQPGRGGLELKFQSRLVDGLPGVRTWFENYPYTCLEQQTSKAIGLGDKAAWQQIHASLPTYLDDDGLASFFPPRMGMRNMGNDTLTAWMLSATHEASRLNPAFALPEHSRQNMIRGLTAFVNGRIELKHWAPRHDLEVRKLAAIEALTRFDAAQPRMLDSLKIAPQQLPTHALLDWINILHRMKALPKRVQLLNEARQNLLSRLSFQGSRIVFNTRDEDEWYWLMNNADVNAARLLLIALDDPGLYDDPGRLVTGLIGRQNAGAWRTTTANLWGTLAIQRFAQLHESEAVSGTTHIALGKQAAQVDWPTVTHAAAENSATEMGAEKRATGTPSRAASSDESDGHAGAGPHRVRLAWPEGTGAQPGAGTLKLRHEGTGKPWVTLQSLAAVPRTQPIASGYWISRKVTPVVQADPKLPAGHYSRGDILRISLEIKATAPMNWVAITDPIPGGASILGTGLGRDSSLATQGEYGSGYGWPAYEERSFESFRSYYEYLPQGTTLLSYTVRLNNIGTFQLPATRVEALYAPEMFGESPNADVTVVAAP